MLVVVIHAILMELLTSLSYLLLPKSNTHDLLTGLVGRESKSPLIIFQLLCFDDVIVDFANFVTASGKLSQTFYINLLDLKTKRSF